MTVYEKGTAEGFFPLTYMRLLVFSFSSSPWAECMWCKWTGCYIMFYIPFFQRVQCTILEHYVNGKVFFFESSFVTSIFVPISEYGAMCVSVLSWIWSFILRAAHDVIYFYRIMCVPYWEFNVSAEKLMHISLLPFSGVFRFFFSPSANCVFPSSSFFLSVVLHVDNGGGGIMCLPTECITTFLFEMSFLCIFLYILLCGRK